MHLQTTVLGAGSWGTTLALLLHANGHHVTLWDHLDEHAEQIRTGRENTTYLPGVKIPGNILITSDIARASAGKDLIVAAVPTQYLRSVIERIADFDLEETVICNVAKGIENETLMTVSELLIEVLRHERKENIAILSGPSHAEEVSRQIPTAVVTASYKEKTARLVQRAFTTPYFQVYVNEDIRGVELGGALKNVIAIAAGISDGAGFGDNTKAAIMTRGIYEISGIGVKMGAKPMTFAGLSGIGDLIVTCMSRHSRNRHVGEQLGVGRDLKSILKEMSMVAEGVPTTKAAFLLAKKHDVDVPIISEVHQVLFEGKDARTATEDLMVRGVRVE